MKEEERGERQRGLFPIRHCGGEREMREPTVYHQTMTRQDRTKKSEERRHEKNQWWCLAVTVRSLWQKRIEFDIYIHRESSQDVLSPHLYCTVHPQSPFHQVTSPTPRIPMCNTHCVSVFDRGEKRGVGEIVCCAVHSFLSLWSPEVRKCFPT